MVGSTAWVVVGSTKWVVVCSTAWVVVGSTAWVVVDSTTWVWVMDVGHTRRDEPAMALTVARPIPIVSNSFNSTVEHPFSARLVLCVWTLLTLNRKKHNVSKIYFIIKVMLLLNVT